MGRVPSLLFAATLGLALMSRVAGAADDSASIAEQRVANARSAIRSNPTQYQGYNSLAEALVLRAEEASDTSYLIEAESAIKKSVELAPNNFETRKIRVSLLLAEDDFPAALDQARSLNKEVPDDVMVYGMLTDADIELGNYGDAEAAAQWMLNLLPGNLPGLTRAARLRELFGETEGAYELMDLAYQSTSPADPVERASILTQMAQIRLAAGRADAAEKLLLQAMESVPAYPPALGAMAQVRMFQHRSVDAVTLLRQRYQQLPSAANLFELAGALQLAGQGGEGERAFSEFELKALQESGKRDNANYDLVLYYADHVHEPIKALEIAKREVAWRRDVKTLDAYAWALHVNGQNAEARKQIEAVLRVGVRDARFYRHAGEIALMAGDTDMAKDYFRKSIELGSQDSEQARAVLAGLSH